MVMYHSIFWKVVAIVVGGLIKTIPSKRKDDEISDLFG